MRGAAACLHLVADIRLVVSLCLGAEAARNLPAAAVPWTAPCARRQHCLALSCHLNSCFRLSGSLERPP
jgi:hypothetical protein